ncbi:MAG: response regulator [Nitrospirae bacterium]|nr:MAG: response regulator [Nitrospirota bacterium]
MECQDPITAGGQMGRVLVVDDVAVVRKSIRATLANAGYDVVEAENGKQAIRILQEQERAEPVPINAILSDLRMPQNNGTELVAYFRRQYPAIPVVVLTAYPDVELAVSLMRQGVMDFLVKPVLQNELLAVVKKAVEQQGRGKQQG